MGAFDPLIPWPKPEKSDDAPVVPPPPPPPPAPGRRIQIGPTDI
jgi:hypothetical protein